MPGDADGPARTVPAGALAALQAGVQGAVLVPGDESYEAAHLIWNARAQRRPAVVVQCASARDVVATVRFAREHGLPLAVRGGGYSPSGQSSGDGVVADLRAMRAVHVDPLGRTAVVAAGVTWGVLDMATQRHRYAVPGVPVSSIGVAGSTLGGGFGYLRRVYGLACDNLIGADLVTADGERMTTSGDERPELLWGLRGGGGNFGVITTLRFRLRPLPEPVLCGPLMYAGAAARTVLDYYRDYTAALREDVTTRVSLFGARDPATPPEVRRAPGDAFVGITVACVGHPDDSGRLVEPLRGAAPVLVDRLAIRPYPDLQATSDDHYPPGHAAAVTSVYVDELDDALVATLCERHAAMPRGGCELRVHHMGGAVGRVARMSTAVPNRAARYLVTAMARWPRTADETAHREWLAATGAALRGHAAGGPHLGFTSELVSSVDVYGAERYLRLAALKRRYDPDNVFAANQNVVPLA